MPGTHLVVEAAISVNPTRFVAHQLSRRFVGRRFEEWPPLQPLLATREVSLGTPSEFVLDGSDNVLLTPASQAFGRSEAWPAQLESYLSGVRNMIADAISEAVEDAGGVLGRPSEYVNLYEAETYWEFAADDPTALVRNLEAPLFEWAHKPQTRRFAQSTGSLTRDFENNSRQLIVQVQSGVRLRVYAKTSRRVRFEVIHDLRQNARPIGRHTSEDFSALFRWLDALRHDAAVALNLVFEHIERRSVLPPDGWSTAALVRHVCEVCGRDAEAILGLLIGNGWLRVGVHDPVRGHALGLVEAGVLERTGATYTVRPPYQRALAELRGVRRSRSRD
jgi:hypothetical protein